jgi:glycosyltransferase involved in cell wall biosynthesis
MEAAAGKKRPLVAIYLPDLSGGGAERVSVSLAPVFAESGFSTVLLLDRRQGELLHDISYPVEVDCLDAKRPLAALPRLVRYLKTRRPDVLVSNTEHMNIIAIWARALARVQTKIIVCQHNALSEQTKRRNWRYRILPFLYRAFLPLADGIVAVSNGVAADMGRICRTPRRHIDVIYNGVISNDFRTTSRISSSIAGTEPKVPFVLAVGRLVPQKDYSTLLRAFAEVCRKCDVNLIILGEGPEREELMRLAVMLGIAHRIALPGFIANPFDYMRAASALVLSSRFEGFGNVLAEALACGTPVVSTDCRFGPSEILDNGRYGQLVPVGDSAALASAIVFAMDKPLPKATLQKRGAEFTVARCASAYMKLFQRVLRNSNVA